MRRTKIELKPALKAQDFNEGQSVKEGAFISSVTDVQTKFGENTIITLVDGDSVFMNAVSNNNLVSKYGEDDLLWIGKPIRIICEKDKIFGKNMLVIYPL